MEKTALISNCGHYRYRLGRRWNYGLPVLWIMLNPSTADANIDDRTISRCIGFTRSWGYSALLVGNIFPYRATNPKELASVNRWGFDNASHLREMCSDSALIVVAWGANKLVTDLDINIALPRADNRRLKCLGLTSSGAPLHPLYQKADTALIDYP